MKNTTTSIVLVLLVLVVMGNAWLNHRARVGTEQELKDKSARYETYLRSILHGEAFAMDKRDNWLVGEWVDNATVKAYHAP